MKRILFIASGFPPYLFSENIVNGKLVLALQEAGYKVDVISRKDEGPSYGQDWKEPFLALQPVTKELSYPIGNKIERLFDTIISGFQMGYIMPGIRWARRAYKEASKLIDKHNYDLIITRSPSDIPHLVGLKLKKKKNIKWLANWNDPAASIWPAPYSRSTSKKIKSFEREVLKNADYLSFPSHTLKDHFVKHYTDINIETKHYIIPHISLLETFIDRKINNSIKSDTLRLCHAGNLSKERDPENLFKSLQYLIEKNQIKVEVDILGHINPEVKFLIEKYQLENVVHFLGGLPYLSALNKMKEYDALILLEAKMDFGIYFPSKLTDYVQLGIPVLAISPAKGYVKEIISKYGGGICVDNTNEKEIKSALKEIYNTIIVEQNAAKLISENLIDLYSTKTVVGIYNSIGSSVPSVHQ